MSLRVAITVILQVFFIVHAVHNDRPFWWALVILAFPVVGCVAYCIVEVFPGSRSARLRAPTLPVPVLVRRGVPQHRLAEVTRFGSVNAKIALAETCLRLGASHDAVHLLESCVGGAYAGDPYLQSHLARVYLMTGQHALAGLGVERIRAEHPKYRPQEMKLMQARALEGQNEADAALKVYEDLAQTYVGFEAKARYGLLLKALGQTRQARTVFNLIVGQAKRAGVLIDSEKQWVVLAYREIVAQVDLAVA